MRLDPTVERWPALDACEAHLWWIELAPGAGDVAAALATVSADERARAIRLRVEVDRTRFLLRRQALRAILSAYTGVPPHELVFDVDRFGKPAWAAPLGAAGLSFSLSHSGGVALLAVARDGRLGVDIEVLRPLPDVDVIARRMFSPAEYEALAAESAADRCPAFLRVWTCKEAVVKALGGGLSIALDGFAVCHCADQPPFLVDWRLGALPRGTLSLLPVPQVAGYAIALAADAPVKRCRLLRWSDGTHRDGVVTDPGRSMKGSDP